MPHQCTECGHEFPDGSKEMLGGCPDCGGNKFQFHKGEIPEGSVSEESPPSRPGEQSQVASAVGKAADTIRGFVGGSGETPESARDVRTPDAADRDADARTDPAGRDTDAGGVAAETEQATLDAVTDDASDTGDDAADAASDRASLGSEGEWPETARPPEHDEDDEIIEADESVDVDAGVSSTDDEAASPGVDAEGASPVTGDVESTPTGSDDAGSGDAEPASPGDSFGPPSGSSEDSAQADARSAVVDEDELPPGAAGGDGQVAGEPSGDRPDLAELREELNDQFESIKVVAPGRYELNLMELYDREEYIIAIQENGKYVIEVPDAWDGPE